ncbi:MAG: discoidin domain-containing protein, partial [Clostridia bacterium]|nr:discoidin domain-containing protein [Clostridia bacterium]
EWIPFAPIASQTIRMDLGAVKALRGMEITPGQGAVVPPYRIYASADGDAWTILADRTGGSGMLREHLAGNYRYIRLVWFGAENNSSRKTISGITLYAEEQ